MNLYLKDPTTGTVSVSLTLLISAFVLFVIFNTLQAVGLLTSTASFNELMYSAMALYFGRRMSVGGKSFSSDAAQTIVDKLPGDGK